MEAEHEEYRRRPAAFDTPIRDEFDWTLEQMATSAAWLADRVPAGVELGFHICSIWHQYPQAGQDNDVLVDAARAIASRVNRPIDYLHLPTIPEHDEADFGVPRLAQTRGATAPVRGPSPGTVEQVLHLHRQVAAAVPERT